MVHAMTRDQQIGRALKLLALPPRQRAECRNDIRVALDWAERGAAAARSFRVAGSKKGKAGVRSYYAALRRTRSAYYALDPAIRPWFSLTETAYIAGKPTLIDREIAIAETFQGTVALQDAMESQVRLELERLKECLAKIAAPSGAR
jgi:hypothetical protein